MKRMEDANRQAWARIVEGEPNLVDIVPAREALPGLKERMILHAGPPFGWDRMCGPMRGAVAGAISTQWKPTCSGETTLPIRPMSWNSGSQLTITVAWLKPKPRRIDSALLAMLRWVISTPLGIAVEPEVYCRKASIDSSLSGRPGKSSLAERLSEVLPADKTAVVPMDGFHFDDIILNQRGLRSRKGAPETFDFAGFAALLGRIRSGDVRHDPKGGFPCPHWCDLWSMCRVSRS